MEKPPTRNPWLAFRALVRGFLSPRFPGSPLLRPCRDQAPARPMRTREDREYPSPPHRSLDRRSSFFFFRLWEFLAEFRSLLAHIQPIKKRVGIFQPDAEPTGDLFFFRAFARFDFVIAGNHFRPALTQPANFHHPRRRRIFSMRLEAAQQFVKPHQTDFGIAH